MNTAERQLERARSLTLDLGSSRRRGGLLRSQDVITMANLVNS